MPKPRKILESVLQGSANTSFRDFQKLVEAFGFQMNRVRGSHHIYERSDVHELINIQNVNGEAKPYQIRQFLRLVESYNLTLTED